MEITVEMLPLNADRDRHRVALPAIEVAGPTLNWQISVATPAHRRVSAASRAFLAELVRAAGSSPQ